ncbi:DUF4168 domain-containing protein [Sphingomonas sp. Y38-1Y]|jgi:hypothetical protein|uniref:DUF4168 domain-containing protein n=1 Tax=Sphingomonas sp. Y38-1Y TaxID=3078265 RepID=UPI0028E8D063|nr:DUF4168 domain-containing protein [Sphingomonas sp. Y38-1Y]
MRSFTIAAAAIAATFAAAAGAQQTPPAGGAADPAQSAPPAASATPPAASAAAGPVSDAEVGQFATALAEVDKINKDTAAPAADKQTKMAAAVTSAGLTPERFNTIATAMSSDTALQGKVAAALQAKGAAPSQ